MDIVMTILRIIHIFSGIIWMGTAFYILLIYSPAMKQVEPQVAVKMNNAAYNKTRFNLMMPLVALGTTLSGVFMYIYVSDTFNAAWFNDTGNIVLTIGSLAGLAAFGHGFSLGQKQDKYAKTLKESLDESGNIAKEKAQDLMQQIAMIERSGKISAWLGVVAILGMSAARWL